jgi:phosphopantetheine adenylyltransferase
MNELTKFLVEGILNETTEKVVALFGGGFKPPTKGHLDVVNQGIKQNPEISEVKILVGGGERNGFTQDQAIKIWNLYNDIGFINKPATIIPVSSPFTYYKNYLKDNPDDKVYVFIGSRPDDEKDQMDVKQRSEFVKKYSDNVIPVEVATTGGVSGTLARKLFKTDIDGFRNMFPENLLDEDFDKILDILNNKSTDNTRKSTPKATEPLTPLNEGDPKKGTGKKPKGSGRRLYTDEDPKDTVGVKFSTRQDIIDTLSKKSFKAKSHARQSQIINLIHQRVRAALSRTKDPAKKKKLKSGFEYIKGKKEASKKKTQRLKKQKLKENQMSMDDFNLVAAVLRDKNKAKKIHNLLLQMFPKQKELLDYNYKNDSYAEFKRVIFHIDKYKIEGPKLIQHTKLKLDPEIYKERDRKYEEYAKGKIKKYFRDSDSDPRTLDLSKLPPITIDSNGEVMDGNHRAFLAIKQQKPLKAYQIIDAKNTHPNVEKILNIVGRKKQEENIDPKSQSKHKGKAAPFGSAYEPVDEGDTYEKMAAKGKKAGSLKQGTVRRRLKIPKDKKIPLSLINKELSRLKKMDKDKDKKGVQLGDKNQKYYKALQLSKTLKTTTNINENATYTNYIDYKQQIKDLTKHMIKKGMNILPLPRVIFKHSDTENASQFLGKTAYYSPSDTTIVLYTEGRHPKDIARSFAHEMIHHIQHLEGRLHDIQTTNTNDDDHLNDIEREAYTKGNMVFRNWTDNMDGTEVSSLSEKKKPYKHKSGFDDKLGKDPFGLNQYARELMEEFQIEDIKPAVKSLEKQEEVRIFNPNCGCDKT